MEDKTSLARVLIADDHYLIREALRGMLSGEPDLEVVGEATNGREALELFRRLQPNLMLMDVKMPEMDGLEATRTIKEDHPEVIVLMVTAFEDLNYLLEAVRVGAAGYVLKHASRDTLLGAVRGVLDGESPLNQELAMQLLKQLAQKMKREAELAAPTSRRLPEEHPEALPPGLLTPREVDVLRLLVRGQTNREIARELSIAVSTTKNHVQHIIAKLGVSDRTQAAVRTVELGLFAAEQEEV